MIVTSRFSGFLAMALVLGVDQWSKQWVLSLFQRGEGPLTLTPFLNIVLSGNAGVSFGLLKMTSTPGILFLVGFASVLSLYLAWCLWRSSCAWSAILYGLVLGGALGNITDRIRYGKVIDFIDIHGAGYHWYTFNIADSAIVLGILFLLYQNQTKRLES